MKIKLKNIVTSNVLELCNQLQELNYSDEYLFDISNVNTYEPFSMLLASRALKKFSLKGNKCSIVNSDNNPNYKYAAHMGFFKSFDCNLGNEPGEAVGSTSYLPITKICFDDLDFKDSPIRQEAIEKKSKEIAVVLSQSNIELTEILTYLLREIIRNVYEHSRTNIVWICAQYWWNKDLAEIAILDEGIGIWESLNSNVYHKNYLNSNLEALKWSLKPGISGVFSPNKKPKNHDIWTNSGYGLYIVKNLCTKFGGWFVMVSNGDCVRCYADGKNQEIKTNFEGTAISLRIKPSKITNVKETIMELNVNGEKEAQNIRNAFKESSIPSKGLL